MNALQLLKERELRVQLRNSSKKAVARGSESGDYTSAHLSPVKLAKEKVAPTQLKYRGVTMRPCVPIGSDSCFTQGMKPHFGGAFCLDGLIMRASRQWPLMLRPPGQCRIWM